MHFFGKSDKTITISTETVIKTILLTVAAYLLVLLISDVTHQLRLIAVSAFLALALNPAVTWLTHRLKSKSRVRATGVAYIIVLSLLIGLLWLIVPPLVNQGSEFARDLPRTVEEFKSQDSAASRLVRRYNLDEQLSNISDDLSSGVGDFGSQALSTVERVGGTIISVITVLILTFMMLIEGPIWFERVMALQPEKQRTRRRKLAQKMYRVVTGYVNGQVLIAAIAAAFALVALLIMSTIFDASINAVAMAGIVFIFGLIPLFGNVLSAVLVVLFSLFASAGLALGMAIYFLVYQQIENATLQPYIQSKSNQLTPLTVFVAALIGVGVAGVLGALAAIPIAGCMRIVLEDKLKDRLPSLETVEQD